MGNRLLLQTHHTLDGSSASRSTQILWTDYLILLFYLFFSLFKKKNKISGETWQTQDWLIFGVHTNLHAGIFGRIYHHREMAKNWKLCIKTLHDQNWETEFVIYFWDVYEARSRYPSESRDNSCITWKDFQPLWWYDLRHLAFYLLEEIVLFKSCIVWL